MHPFVTTSKKKSKSKKNKILKTASNNKLLRAYQKLDFFRGEKKYGLKD